MLIELQNKNIMALSPSHRQFQTQRMKVILKEALKKRPISIQSLKKSFCINHSHLEGFVKYMKDPPNFFPTSTNQDQQARGDEQQTELSGLRNIVKNINRKTPTTKDIFLKRNSIKGKQIKQQLKLQRSELKMEPQTPSQANYFTNSFYKAKPNNCLQNMKQKMIALDVRSNKLGNNSALRKGKNSMRNTFSVHMFKFQNQNLTPNQMKFARKSDKMPSHRRWKTQGDLKSQQRSLSSMTKYCEKKNMKGINYLVLQLQLNVQGSKKMRKTSGPFY